MNIRTDGPEYREAEAMLPAHLHDLLYCLARDYVAAYETHIGPQAKASYKILAELLLQGWVHPDPEHGRLTLKKLAEMLSVGAESNA